MPGQDGPNMPRPSNGRFAVTRWTIVLAAKGDDPAARSALQQLCSGYWYPVYAFVRGQNYAPHDAEDLTQSFFQKLMEKKWLDGVGREKGRFRSFLLVAVRNFLANERDYANALKRGGKQRPVSLDAGSAESRYANEPRDNTTPEKLFDRHWARTLLARVLDALSAEMVAKGDGRLFEELKVGLTGERPGYAQIGEHLGKTDGAVKVAAHRLKQRYRELIREEIAQTVDSEKDIEDELQDLRLAVGR
jgi:RNA polymerase sigma-70 factor (ECF subfamily)